MPSVKHEALADYIDELVKATEQGKIDWNAVNPTTFVWETTAPRNARVSLQRVERTVSVRVGSVNIPQKAISYLFQVVDLKQPTPPILIVDTAEDNSLKEKLAALFNLMKTGISDKTLEFLKSILPQ